MKGKRQRDKKIGSFFAKKKRLTYNETAQKEIQLNYIKNRENIIFQIEQ